MELLAKNVCHNLCLIPSASLLNSPYAQNSLMLMNNKSNIKVMIHNFIKRYFLQLYQTDFCLYETSRNIQVYVFVYVYVHVFVYVYVHVYIYVYVDVYE